jgi:hypothetical protein
VSKSSNQKTYKVNSDQIVTNPSDAHYLELLNDQREMKHHHEMARVQSGAMMAICFRL